MQLYGSKTIWALLATAGIVGGLSLAHAQQEQRGATSYLPVDIKESFASIMARMKAAEPDIEKKHADLLDARYDLSNRPAKDATMSHVRVNVTNGLPEGTTVHWHGISLQNQMDGPVEITQAAILPNATYSYAFTAEQYGSVEPCLPS